MLVVIKKDNSVQDFLPEKIKKAIVTTANRCDEILSDADQDEVVSLVKDRIEKNHLERVTVKDLHNYVELALDRVNPVVAANYRSYRNYKNDIGAALAHAVDESLNLHTGQDKENANSDTLLCANKRAKRCSYFSEEIYKFTEMPADVRKAHNEGFIYVHDLSMRLDSINCCLFDVANVLSGGFDMEEMHYTEPKSLRVAFDVIGDIVLSAASQQYGGFTVPEVDSILEPYAEKSFRKYVDEICEVLEVEFSEADEATQDRIVEKANAKVRREFEQGFQGWEYKFNTVGSSRGDYPFVTLTFGLNTSYFGKMASCALLKVRREGQASPGGTRIPVPFPKLVFLYDKNIHKKGEEVYESALACSMDTMYPDWLSLTGEGYIASIYKRYKKAISPMGCRAFLSPWYERGGMQPMDEADTPVYIGRFNIGAVSLNLPMIYQKARVEGAPFMGEGGVLDQYLEMIRKIHQRTYDYLGRMKASHNPLGFTQGGFLNGNLAPDDVIKPCLQYATASFGITALNELQMLHNGKGIAEDSAFVLEVMEYINKKIAEFKEEDGHLYAIYGTPAESLCGKQVTKFRTKYGIIEGVSDRPYVSNSFHCHVTADISPVEKQNREYPFWELFNGGKIQYCRYPVDYNRNAVEELILRAMEMGYYEGVNLSLAYCNDCGHRELDMDVCPVCGSRNLTKIDRMNGYLAYSRTHGTHGDGTHHVGETRLNDAKMAEIAERKSM